MHSRQMIILFYQKHPKKPTTISVLTNSNQFIVISFTKLKKTIAMKTTKQKQG